MAVDWTKPLADTVHFRNVKFVAKLKHSSFPILLTAISNASGNEMPLTCNETGYPHFIQNSPREVVVGAINVYGGETPWVASHGSVEVAKDWRVSYAKHLGIVVISLQNDEIKVKVTKS